MNNPVFKREWKMRWRNRKTTFLIFAYAALLAIFVGWIYNDNFHRLAPGDYSFARDASRVGRELFISLCGAQLGAWLLLAPALTATGISRERERGLLEGVQLSLLSPRQIIAGNFRSALGFLVLLLPVALPVTSICFLLGGVSPAEMGILTLLQFVSATNAAAIGIFFAARSRRAMGALVGSFIFGAIWLVGSTMGYGYYNDAMRWGGMGAVPNTEEIIAGVFGLLNPLCAFESIIETTRPPKTLWDFSPWPQIPFWAVNVVIQVLMTIVLLEAARRAVARPFPPELSHTSWSEPIRRAWRSRMERLAQEAESRRERASLLAAQRAGDALLWEIPLHRFINFKDPVLRREVQSKFRWRGNTWWSKLLQLGAVLLGGLCFVWILYNVFDPLSRASTWWALANLALAALMFACGLMGATAFTREREGGTWEGLQLSLLRPREILRAKFIAPLVACFYYSLPITLVALFYIRPGAPSEYSNGFMYSHLTTGVAPSQALGTFMVLIGAAVFCVAFGLFVSSLCERTVTSVAWTLGSLLAMMTVGLYVAFTIIDTLNYYFSGLAFSYYNSRAMSYIWHPFFTLEVVRRGFEGYISNINEFKIHSGYQAAIPFLIATTYASVILVTLTNRILERKMRPEAAVSPWQLDTRSRSARRGETATSAENA